jgi:DsbC/DsbD-like thiol-disulfide interchange protein
MPRVIIRMHTVAPASALSVVAALLVGATSLLAQSTPFSKASSQHAVVTLVAERSAAVPGQPLALGVRFEIDPKWHIYWVNPGDSGGPPAIEWKLPEGFQAGAFDWPIPQRIPIGEGLVNYGYESDVLLPVTVRVPASAKPGTQVDLSGRVRYMICSELCVPARADIHLPVTIAATAGAPAPTASLFAQTRPRIPQRLPATMRAQASFDAGKRQFTVRIDTGSADTSGQAQFFPLAAGQIDDASPQLPKPTPGTRGVIFILRASDQLTTPPKTLSGIVVFSETRAYTIDAPVQ